VHGCKQIIVITSNVDSVQGPDYKLNRLILNNIILKKNQYHLDKGLGELARLF
jgi:hypothetical protein